MTEPVSSRDGQDVAGPAPPARKGRRVLFALVLALGIGVATYSARDAMREVRATEICEAAARRDWPAAVALASDDDHELAPGAAADCHCLALVMTGDRFGCAERALRALSDDAWVPDLRIAEIIVDELLRNGRAADAALIVDRVAGAPLVDADAQGRALDLRMSVATGDAARLEAIAQALALMPCCSDRHERFRQLTIGRPELLLVALGDSLPRDPNAAALWVRLRGTTLAGLGRVAQVETTLDMWRASGAKPAVVAAERVYIYYSQTLPVAMADDVKFALQHKEDLDPEAVGFLFQVWVQFLRAHNNDDGKSLSLVIDMARSYDPALRFDEVLAAPEDPSRNDTVSLHVTPPPGFVLHVSPDPALPVDAAYETHAAQTRITRRLSSRWPTRWVLARATDGATCASGVVWPHRDGTTSIAPPAAPNAAGTCQARRTWSAPSRRAADGRTRVAVVILDSGDWHIVRHLAVRGEVPFMAHMIDAGRTGVLVNEQASTIVAMRKLLTPAQTTSAIGAVDQLGEQIALFGPIGGHPFPAVRALVSQPPSLLELVGDGDRRAVNLLANHGGLGGGSHGAIFGPRGAVSTAALTIARPFTAEEMTDVGLQRLAQEASDGSVPHILMAGHEMAGGFDDVIALARSPTGFDLALARVDAVDLASHGYFDELRREGADRLDNPLLAIMRNADTRLAELWSAMDEDDVLIVISDHGTRTALEHDEHCLFLALGADRNRIDGAPAIQGLARALAAVLGIDVPAPWPDTHITIVAAD